MVDRRDVAGIRKILQEALRGPIDYARGSLLTEVGSPSGWTTKRFGYSRLPASADPATAAQNEQRRLA